MLAKYIFLISTLSMLSLFSCSNKKMTSFKPNEQYNLVWADEFDYTGLPDTSKWSYDVGGNGWGNNEKQYYTKESLDNSFVKDGILHIVALKENYQNNDYTSTRLITNGKYTVKYGRIEVRAKLPKGNGTWPAIWMLGANIQEVGWPLCGEIDIMEHVGKDQNVVHVSLHSKLYNFIKNNQLTHFERITDVSNAFHLYGIEWSANSIKFFIDDKLFYTTIKGDGGRVTTDEGWPFDKPFYLILNLAIGGNWGGEIDNSIFPTEMQIDYVRIYKK